MIGHRQVIAARRAGYKPAAVFLHIGPARSVGKVDVPIEDELAQGSLPVVYTDTTKPQTADLRWLVGLRVHVVADRCSSEMFWKWWDAVCEAKPDHAYAVEPDGEVLEWRAS